MTNLNTNPLIELEGKRYFLPEGHLTYDDEFLLLKYSKNTNLCVEAGTFKGRSAILMAINAKKVVTIDLFPDYRTEYPDLTFENLTEYLKQYPNIELRKNLSWEEAKNFEDESIDLFFQDAGHSIGEVYKDFESYLPKIKKNGIIIFHDYLLQRGQTDESMDVYHGVQKCLETGLIEKVEERGWCFVGRKI